MKEGAANSVRAVPVNRKAKAPGRGKSVHCIQYCITANLKSDVRSLRDTNSLSVMMSKACP